MALVRTALTHWPWAIGAILLAMIVLALIRRTQYAWTVTDTGQSELSSLHEPYWLRVLVAFDVFCNVVAGGIPDETISARCGRWAMRPHGHLLQKFINRWLSTIQADHGLQAATGDLGRAQRVVRLEQAALAAYAKAHPEPPPDVPH